ncbi:MAG: GntR family transcriptional regulator, partial [Deltaproteobacteria bacterium]|nr:GntR family transcriptional regulator [Deltaproteobacteria bacterium]
MNTILPIYYQIKQTIKNWIINKKFSLGEKIPSENELAEKFNVSRLTIRQAIPQLIQEGFLQSRRGKGTFVTENENLINRFNLETIGFMDALFYQQISKIKIKSVFMNRVVPPKLIKEKLELNNEEKKVVQIKRVRILKEKLFTYTINYLPLVIGARITEKDLYERPLLQILEQDMGIRFTEVVQKIEASFADKEVAEKLEIASESPIHQNKQIEHIVSFKVSGRGNV